MQEQDRSLLHRMATLNASLGEATLRMIGNADSGDLRVDDLRRVGLQLVQLGVDLLVRAEQQAGPTIDADPT